MRPNRGSHYPPHHLQEECIRVPKVYDWVFDAFSTDRGINLPVDCAATVAEAVAEGRTPLDVECEVPDVGGFFPLNPDPDPNATCLVSSVIDRREMYDVEGELREVAIVKVIFTIRPLITIFDSEGVELCSFRTTISESRRLVVCAPEPFTSDNVFCRIIALNCDTNFIETGDPNLDLQIILDVCFEVQVEAEVKLEVLAKFCFPRENDIEIPAREICPIFEWPDQCDFFPRDHDDCDEDDEDDQI